MPESILIVDDNTGYAQWTEAVLRKAGYSDFTHVKNARAGLDAVRSNPPFSAIFSDITMEHPGAGLMMIPKLRKLGYSGVVILESTAFDYEIVYWLARRTLRSMGVDGLVIKRLMNDHGRWEVQWISQREGVSVLRERLTGITEIPDWKDLRNEREKAKARKRTKL